MANRLKEKYTNEVIPALTEKFNYSSVMAVPKVCLLYTSSVHLDLPPFTLVGATTRAGMLSVSYTHLRVYKY